MSSNLLLKIRKLFITLLLVFASFIAMSQSSTASNFTSFPPKNGTGTSKTAPLNNFSDSVYSIKIPSAVLWKFQCDEIEPFMNAAFSGALKNNVTFEEAPSKPRAFYSQEENCAEGLILIDDDTMIAEKYFLHKEYFKIWDTQNVDPYEYKIKDFKDTVLLELFNREKNLAWSQPLARETKVNSKYGARWYRWHHGVDLEIDLGDPIQAVFDGVVRIAKYNRGGYGYYVMIRHDNGLETLYGHLAKYNVKPGDVVKAGDLIGYGGSTGRSTGPHLHFEVRYQGHAFDPRHMFDFDDNGGKLYFREFVLTPFHYKGLINQAKGQYHKVRNGDSLWVISRRYRTPIRQLCRLNGISKSTVLRVGKVLRVQ